MKRKVLVINTVPFVMGGISSVIVNYYKAINKDKFQLDIVVNSYIEHEFEILFEKEDSSIYRYNRNKNPIKYIQWLYKLIKDNSYDVVHVHGNSATMTTELLAAKLAGCPIRIAHSHNSECKHKAFHALLSPLFKRLYTLALACSELAGDWIFGKGKYDVLPNGIETERYKFSETIRNRVRKELSLESKLVIGHVGFMNEQKNHPKLFEIIAELKKKQNDIHLLCVTGDEVVPKNLQILIKEKKIEDNITILYKRNDVNELLQAMDAFVFPSRWEGLPVVLIEAQITGLPCFASDRITKEVDFGEINWCSIDEQSEKWVELILGTRNESRDRLAYYKEKHKFIKQYQIEENVKKLEKLYI